MYIDYIKILFEYIGEIDRLMSLSIKNNLFQIIKCKDCLYKKN